MYIVIINVYNNLCKSVYYINSLKRIFVSFCNIKLDRYKIFS